MITWQGGAEMIWREGTVKVFDFETSWTGDPDRVIEGGYAGFEVPRLIALSLLCKRVRADYAVSPRQVRIEIQGDERPGSLTLTSASWKYAVGRYCFGRGIVLVPPPPTGAELVRLEEARAS